VKIFALPTTTYIKGLSMKRASAYLLALLMPVALHAQINTIPAAPHLLVRGHAETSYMPDRFSISLRVQVTDPLPAKARERVEAHMATLFKELAKAGAMKGQTQASTLQIVPASEYRDGKQVFLGTQVTRQMVATFDAMPKLVDFIRDLSAGEEVQVTGTSARRSDLDAIQQKLRKEAMVNSQEAARHMAAAYGMRVTGVYSVSEVAPDFSYGIQAGSWSSASPYATSSLAPPAPPAPPSYNNDQIIPPDLRIGTLQAQQDIYAVYLIGSP
jgi:uncharacterized protein